MDNDSLYSLIKLAGTIGLLIMAISWYYGLAAKPQKEAKKLYLKVMEQYNPISALRIRIDDSGNGSLKQIPSDRKQCYLLLYHEEISIVTIDEPIIRINIPLGYFRSYQIVKDDYINLSYIENSRYIKIRFDIYPLKERKNFNEYALKQYDYYQYFETHISKGDQSPTIINL